MIHSQLILDTMNVNIIFIPFPLYAIVINQGICFMKCLANFIKPVSLSHKIISKLL